MRYIILAIVAVIVGYNFFVAGIRFSLNQMKSLQNVMVGVMSTAVIGLLVFAVILFKTLCKLKKELRTVATKHHLDLKLFRKEFHNFVKATFGGPG